MPRLDLAHHFAESLARRVEGTAGAPGKLWRLSVHRHKQLRRHKGFVDCQIRILGIFQEPFIRKRIPTDNHFHPAIFNRVAYGPIAGVHRGPGTNRYSVLLIHHLVDGLVVELGGLDSAGIELIWNFRVV